MRNWGTGAVKQIRVVTRTGVEKQIAGRVGMSIMELIRESGISDSFALCGGCCSCATCHVYVDSTFGERLPPIGDAEAELLESSGRRRSGSRLSCQLQFLEELDGVKVTIAPEP
jgi:2Fe-2S ferredoxin